VLKNLHAAEQAMSVGRIHLSYHMKKKRKPSLRLGYVWIRFVIHLMQYCITIRIPSTQ